MDAERLNVKKIADFFGSAALRDQIIQLEKEGRIPKSERFRRGALFQKGWEKSSLPLIADHIGFLKKVDRPMAISVFTTKGGVLKTTLSLNIARLAALHGLKTLVIGLDIQADVTTALGFGPEEEGNDLGDMIMKWDRVKGLNDYFKSEIRMEEMIIDTDLENLFLIPETPELVHLGESLNNLNRREYWIKEKIVDRLKQNFDLIVMDCSPNWNRLTTNALVASDLLVSPLECKINNFRNFKVFKQFLKEFKRDMRLDLETLFVPTRFSNNRKLSLDILRWYRENLPNCTSVAIRDCVLGEEAVALHQSFVEHNPRHQASSEMRQVVREVFEKLNEMRVGERQQMNSEGMSLWL